MKLLVWFFFYVEIILKIIFILIILEQLRNVYRKLESDLQSSKKRLMELVNQNDALKKGREESVSIFC